MTERYTKTILTIIAVALTALVFERQSISHTSAQTQVNKPPLHCVWTYITDQGRPNLGKNGNVDLHDPDWKKVSDEGWQLKAIGQNGLYVFERCE